MFPFCWFTLHFRFIFTFPYFLIFLHVFLLIYFVILFWNDVFFSYFLSFWLLTLPFSLSVVCILLFQHLYISLFISFALYNFHILFWMNDSRFFLFWFAYFTYSSLKSALYFTASLPPPSCVTFLLYVSFYFFILHTIK